MAAGDSNANDIRAEGWAVAVHNDYRLRGEFYTFWLFTKDDRAIKGEGKTDAEALDIIRRQIGLIVVSYGADQCPSNPAISADHCLMCLNEACNKCGAGCWNRSINNCEHDTAERHEEPDLG